MVTDELIDQMDRLYCVYENNSCNDEDDYVEYMGAEKCAVCMSSAGHRCSRCQNIYYCSREHQKKDWKQHRGNCRPFKIAVNDTLGRHLVATRDIKEHEVILREAPLVAGPSQMTSPVCLGCYRSVNEKNSQECSSCGWPVCSEKCAKMSAHKPECDLTSNRRESKVSIRDFLYPHPLYQCLAVLRCMYQREYNPEVWKKIVYLQSHDEERKAMPRYQDDRVRIAQFIRRFFKYEEFTEDEILRLCGIVEVNGHEVPVTEPPHVAIYEVASLLEHHCRPNCSKSFTSSAELIVRTAMPVKKGENLSICYSDALWGTANRRHHLFETKFFWCNCERCSDPTEFDTYFSAIKCRASPCTGYLLPEYPLLQGTPDGESLWKCKTCDSNITSQEVLEILEQVGQRLAAMEKGDPESCEKFISEFGGGKLLHTNHYHLTDVKLALAQLYGQDCPGGLPEVDDETLEKKIRLCQQMLPLIGHLAPAENRIRGVLMFELHASLAEQARRQANAGDIDARELQQRLLESRKLLMDAANFLQYEAECLPEGKIAIQAKTNLANLDILLRNLHLKFGDIPI